MPAARTTHFHPTPTAAVATEQGNKLANSTSDVFQKGDLIAHTSGRWEPIARSKVGQAIPAADLNYYIRPVGWYGD